MIKIIKGLFLSMVLFSLLTACSNQEYRITNVRIYRDTPIWGLAQAVNRQDTRRIAQIAEEMPELLDYQDPLYGTTLLFWAVGMEKYESTRALLEAGADPDIISIYEGGTALYRAAKFSFIDNDFKKDARFVRLLLEYGADPNLGFVGNARNNITEIGTTPLMASIGCGIDKTRALIEYGADINFQTESGQTAAMIALRHGGSAASMLGRLEYAHYLIVVHQADITRPRIAQPLHGEAFYSYPVASLRDWIFPLDSDRHLLKMEIVREFARQGVDYWATEIHRHQLEQIQRRYPDTWEEYIELY